MEIIQPAHVLEFSEVRKEWVDVSRVYDDGFLFLLDDPHFWIESNTDCVSSVRSLELELWVYKRHEIRDSIGELSELTHLSIRRGDYLKCMPNALSMLHNLHHLEFSHCFKLEQLPANLGDLYNLTSLFVVGCDRLKYLPWSITKLSKLRHLYLPEEFKLETLPPRLNDSIVISVKKSHVRKTWKELKTEMAETLSIQFPIIPEELLVELALKTSTPGYLQYRGDLTQWICDNFDLHSSVRILDLYLWKVGDQLDILDSIEVLQQLTHFYVDGGCLFHHLPRTFTRLTHLSLIDCTFECDTNSHFDSLANLTNLIFLHLSPGWLGVFPKDMDLPISLRHLRLSYFFESIPDSYVESMAKLSNLNTLTLSSCYDLESLPLNLNVTKLILREIRIKSISIGLKHLEIIHNMMLCQEKSCNKHQECLNQLVNLETLSYTCHGIKSLSSVTSLRNLQKLELKDCFKLKELPQDLNKLEKLCTLDVSGTSIQSLPNSIMNLHNLQRLILSKCFILETLPVDFGKKVMISIDDTVEIYYKHQGYHWRGNEIINDCDFMTSDSIKEINETFLETFKQANIIEQASVHRPLNHLPYATRIIEGSHFIGSADPTCNNNPNAFSSSLTHEMEILRTGNEDRTVHFVDECFFNFHRNARQICATMELQVGQSNHHALCSLPNQDIGTLPSVNRDLEMDQGFDPGSNYPTLENDQVENAQHGKVKNKTQKIEITRESIELLLPLGMRLEDAATQLNVSRSTFKRALKNYGMPWPSSRKRKHDSNKSAPHSNISSFGRNLSQLNFADHSTPTGHEHTVENSYGPNRCSLLYNLPSEPNALMRIVEESSISTQCHTNGHQCVEEHSNGAKECELLNAVQPNENCSTFVVKATYNNDDTVRFNFSLSFGIEQLKEEVRKRLDLEVGRFKIYYQDEDKEWMLMTCIADLQYALQLSKESGNNFVRLQIKLKK